MSNEKAVTKEALQLALWHGARLGQSAAFLAAKLDTTPRAIRTLVDDLIEAGVPVCAHPTTGYYIAETQKEVDETASFLRNRAVHGINKAYQLCSAFATYQHQVQPGA